MQLKGATNNRSYFLSRRTIILKYWPIQLLLAVAWLATGYFAFRAFGPQVGFYGALGNLLIGLILLVIVNRSKEASQLLYEGQKVDRDYVNWALVLLVAIPVLCVTAGVVWWFMRLIGVFK